MIGTTVAACQKRGEISAAEDGDTMRGASLISSYGCGACHRVPGVSNADGNVGPPLTGIGNRVFIAGVLRNSADNMEAWLQHPQKVLPGSAMPDMNVSPRDARDLAAFLYTLK